MALTTSVAMQTVVGNKRMAVVDVTFDNSYPTGGEAFSAAAAGITSMEMVVPFSAPGQFVDYASGNLVLYTEAGVEETDASDQSGVSIKVLVVGT